MLYEVITHLLLLLLLLALAYWKVVPGMITDWNNDPNYSHGFLVPLIAGYFVWQKWPQLKRLSVSPNNLGLPVVIASLSLLIFGFAGTEYFSMRASLVFLLIGIVLYWFGWAVLKELSLPLGFLFFMVP